MDDAKHQLIDRLQKANNILVTVSRDPSVDQLASCIALTLLLNKQGKHAAAVFSGKVPSTLEFLKPADTLEKNTDSLRDFIISLDKSKADKLRYKVEEDVVRIFITPYKTSLSEDDLEFSEGDFNVDVVVALGVKRQEDLDQAITAHGRILHDATVTSINSSNEGGLGTINWNDPQASSLSELVTDLSQALGPDMLDGQIATALLTGIVSETGRFSNERTSSQTMSASAALLSAGANQQLVASNLDKGPGTPVSIGDKPGDGDQADGEGKDGVLSIDHNDTPEEGKKGDGKGSEPPKGGASGAPLADDLLPKPDSLPGPDSTPAPPAAPPQPLSQPEPPSPPPFQPPAGSRLTPTSAPAPAPQEPPRQPSSTLTPGPKYMTEPPRTGGTLTANSESEHLDPVTDPMSMPASEQPQLLDRKDAPASGVPSAAPAPPTSTPPAESAPAPSPTPPNPAASTAPAPPPAYQPPAGPGNNGDGTTLAELEKSVDSPHLKRTDLESVRDEVDKALSGTDQEGPIKALNAQPLGDGLHPPAGQAPAPQTPATAADAAAPPKDDSGAPPPVPPPIPFQFGNSPPPSSQQ